MQTKHVGVVVDDSIREPEDAILITMTELAEMRRKRDADRKTWEWSWRVSFRAGVVAGGACVLFLAGTLVKFYPSDTLYAWFWGIGAAIAAIDLLVLEIRRRQDTSRERQTEKAWVERMHAHDAERIAKRMARRAEERRVQARAQNIPFAQEGEEA